MSSVSVLRQLVKVIVEIEDEKEIREYKVDELKFKRHHRKEKMHLSDEEYKELKALEEHNEGKSKLDE